MLRWSRNSLIPRVIRQIVTNSHFKIVEENKMWLGYWGKHMKNSAYQSILPYQKVNHFPGAFHLGRKDRLWANIRAAAERCGWDGWDFMPTSFILPREYKRFKAAVSRQPQRPFILKPPASARGAGIRLVPSWTQVPKNQALVVQDYIARPCLINGSKFDLRLYVYVPSFSPLRVYLYEEGIVRFASLKYSAANSTLANKFIHLTNYSVNKTAANDLPNSSTTGHKWRLRELFEVMVEERMLDDPTELKQRIVDVILRAIIASEAPVNQFVQLNAFFPHSCHELFGFDIILDEDLKPWLLEVNISPSLQSGTDLDYSVKAPLARDVLNMAGLCVPHRSHVSAAATAAATGVGGLGGVKAGVSGEEEGQTWEQLDLRQKPLRQHMSGLEERKWSQGTEEFAVTGRVPSWLLDDLLGADIRVLIESEAEMERAGGFCRIFPSAFSAPLLPLFRKPRYPNLLLHAWARRFRNRLEGYEVLRQLCATKQHIATQRVYLHRDRPPPSAQRNHSPAHS